jgi:uncharacterized protein Yka (UPF0111/DUF47 family)
MSNEKFKQQEELKYEGLAALIMTRFDDMRQENKENFNRLYRHNEKQNGSIATAINRIYQLEEREKTHTLRCPLNDKVRTLEDDSLSAKTIRKVFTKTILMGSALVGFIIGLSKLLIWLLGGNLVL